MERVWIDEKTYAKIMKQAVENNGHVLVDTREHSPFIIDVDVEFAKKEWTDINNRLCKDIHEFYGVECRDALDFMDRINNI